MYFKKEVLFDKTKDVLGVKFVFDMHADNGMYYLYKSSQN